MMAAINRRVFEEMVSAFDFVSGVPVITEDGRIGLINHWNDETCMVDIYVGNDFETIHVPWKNLTETFTGIVVRLEGVIAE